MTTDTEQPHSSRRDLLAIAIAVVSVLGLGVAGYLAYVHYSGSEIACSIAHGCEKVQKSDYAKFLGIPLPVLGLFGYLSILVSLLLRSEIGKMLTAFLSLFGFGFSLYLTYLELFVIDAICQWCVTSAVLMTVVMVLALIRALRTN